MVGGGEVKLEINIPSKRIRAKRKGGVINKGGVISSEYGIPMVIFHTSKLQEIFGCEEG